MRDILEALDIDSPVGQWLQTLAIASHLTFLLILLPPGADEFELIEDAVDSGGWLLDAAPLLQGEFDALVADPGLGRCSAIGSQVGDQLLVMIGGLVSTGLWASREIPQTPPTMHSIRLDPFDDHRSGGSESPGGLRDVLTMGQQEVDHRSTMQLRGPGISDAFGV